ncbi:Predicted secreted acid phosphatase [Actinacidiphila yanglinensis]|uniref:Predicted secreted acid phosphatase n=1 Tax=Actinacidiphila yanglinensis TaxID=310779 RepID=A0A1H6DLV2_9ACTN|nr:HAD family acid phosphatase [Actinacidiphila yanglinensis]SEG86178.1 Predicted secreted acid phosphatase [Actinacidiphila yanglinensis]
MPRARLSLRTRALAVAAAAATLGATFYGVGVATADNSVPRSDQQIPNLTDVVNQIKAYYGDTVDTSGEHQASATSNYAKQVAGIEAKAKAYLAHAEAGAGHDKGHGKGGKPAIVLDVDDTSLLTYNYELEVGFNYTPASNQAYLDTKNMPAVFGIDTLTNWAAAKGITVFWITGRPESQRADTVRNLTASGFQPAADTAHLYLKNTATPPSYLPCGATCTTIEYKSGTRAHIESLGYDIVGNFGDQYSDLSGGHADRSFKLPNPMYYLP